MPGQRRAAARVKVHLQREMRYLQREMRYLQREMRYLQRGVTRGCGSAAWRARGELREGPNGRTWVRGRVRVRCLGWFVPSQYNHSGFV